MKGHTGSSFTMGHGMITSGSTKQKLVTRSSTECEVVGVHDVMPQLIWSNMFLKAQGVKVTDTVLYQDNQSAMLLEQNGRLSSTKRTKHMNIRYFHIKDRIQNGELRVEYCPTGDMVADYFSKPVQGSLFKRMRDAIMNIAPSSKYHSGHRSVLSPMAPAPRSGDVSPRACARRKTYLGAVVDTAPTLFL